MNGYICGDPGHEGDPSNVHPIDRLELRAEYRRISDQARVRTVKIGNVCAGCMNRRLALPAPVLNGQLFGTSA